MGIKDILLLILVFALGGTGFYFLKIPVHKLPSEKTERKKVREVIVAVIGGAAAVFLALYYGYTLQALTVFIFYAVLMVITLIDNDTMEIPPVLNLIILVLGVVSIFTIGDISIKDRIIGMFCISLPMYLLELAVPGGFGGGDMKLMFAAGFLLGWRALLMAFFIAIILAGIYGVYVLVAKKKTGKDHFALGPYLCFGLAVSIICGDYLLSTYIDYLKRMFTEQ